MQQHNIGDPVYSLSGGGDFGYISDVYCDYNKEYFYVVTWLPNEVESTWLSDFFVSQLKRDLKIYLGEIPPTGVR